MLLIEGEVVLVLAVRLKMVLRKVVQFFSGLEADQDRLHRGVDRTNQDDYHEKY